MAGRPGRHGRDVDKVWKIINNILGFHLNKHIPVLQINELTISDLNDETAEGLSLALCGPTDQMFTRIKAKAKKRTQLIYQR